MAYTYDKSPGGSQLSVTRCEDHEGILVIARFRDGTTGVPVCIAAEDVPEVMREMAAWAGLRYLAQEI